MFKFLSSRSQLTSRASSTRLHPICYFSGNSLFFLSEIKYNVGIISGLPDSVLQKAAAMSQEFEENYGKRVGTTKSWEDKASLIIENLMKIAGDVASHTSSESDVADSLTSIQHRASFLLEQS